MTNYLKLKTRISFKNKDGKISSFILATSKKWAEDAYWDGLNWISRCTNSEFNHEALYKTSKGIFVKNSWSYWKGSAENNYETISKEEALNWLLLNNHDTKQV